MKPEDETNLYKPGNPADGSVGMPPPPPKTGSVIAWMASEYIEHQRGFSWYLLLALGTAGLSGGTYLLTKDYFAGGTIVVLGIIVGAFAGRKPGQITFELSNSGLKVGNKAYPLSLFKSFSVLKEGSLTSISLTPIKRFMPPVSAYFEPKDQEKIVNALGEQLPYEERKPSAVDRLSFRLRI